MKFLKELVDTFNTERLNEGVMKLRLYDAVHDAVRQAFDKDVSLEKNIKAVTSRLAPTKGLSLSAEDANGSLIRNMVIDEIDSRLDSLIAARLWVLSSDLHQGDADITAQALSQLHHLKSFAHLQSDELSRRIAAAGQHIKSTPASIRENALGEGAAAPIVAAGFELEVDFDQVHLLDEEKTIKISMPLKIWLKLAKQSISRYG